MVHDIQKASLGKRLAAWLLDAIMISVLAVGFGLLLSWLLGYDGYYNTLDSAYVKYEEQYGVVFNITAEAYEALTDAQRENYEAAYAALTADSQAMNAYNMILNLNQVIISFGILLAFVLWELLMPLWFGNGQTLGKKIFGICLIRNDGIKLNNLQLFARTILGKYTVETMIPLYILMLIFMGAIGALGTIIILGLLAGQFACVVFTRNRCAIHDLLAGTVAVDMASQMIFRSTEEKIEYQKKAAADLAARQEY